MDTTIGLATIRIRLRITDFVVRFPWRISVVVYQADDELLVASPARHEVLLTNCFEG
jgi:hypothetical protein